MVVFGDILFYTFLGVTIIQLCFYLAVYSRFAFGKSNKPSVKNIGVSVLVCAKNEAENLKQFIPELIQQEYSKFEIVLINDGSTDDSLDIMQRFESEFEQVKVVDVKPNDAFWGNKKYPLTLGIKSSTYDFLLFTDADCRPLSSNWIKEMSRHFSNEHSIVLGYGAYKKVKGSLLNMLIRFETVFTAIQYFSYAMMRFPYMGVGRNLAYRKELFFETSGFTRHMQVQSGDDDIFVNDVANATNTAYSFERESFTESMPQTKMSDWIRQKKRHLSASPYYKPKHKLLLGLFYVSQLLFWALAISLIILQIHPTLIFILLGSRTLVFLLIYGFSAKKLNELGTVILSPFMELFLILMQLFIFISNLTSKKHHWR